MIGAISSAHPLATEAGLKILEKGGNSFDAAVTVASVLNVVEPAMSGLGGYGSTLIYDSEKKEIHYLNSSGKFPKNINPDLMRSPTINYLKNREGAKSISTPGNLKAWKEMHSKYGKMLWSSLFEDAICYAKTGFPLPPYTAKLITDSFKEFSDYSKSFYGKDGHPLQENDLLVQTDLAKTYELIASGGTESFYQGEIAYLLSKQMKKSESFLSIEDLHENIAEWNECIKLNYKGHEIYTIGTPGNGFLALFILGIMNQFPLQELKHNSLRYLHILIEVLKEASKIRAITPGIPAGKDKIISNILTNSNFSSIANLINMTKVSKFDIPYTMEGTDTTHFVVVDKWGNIVSCTQTLGASFGSKVMVEGTGIWMNNSMTFSTFEPKNNPMDVSPGGYKISGNAPIIIMKNKIPWAALGTPGGHTIPQNIAQVVINLIDFKMNMQEAIDAPKIAFFEESKVICAENSIPNPIVSELKTMGHSIDNDNIANYIGLSGKIGNTMGVKIFKNKGESTFEIGVDKRKDGWSITHSNNNKFSPKSLVT